MAESMRKAVLKQISAHLAADVRPVNQYVTDLSGPGAVSRGRFYIGDDDPLPMVSILEGINADRFPDTANYGQAVQKDNWILLVQGWVKDDKVNPTDPAHDLMADVKKSLSKIRENISECLYRGTPLESVAGIIIEPGVVRPPDQISTRAYFWMRIVLNFVEDLGDPYWEEPSSP